MSTPPTAAVSIGFHHVAIKVHDYDRAVKFYEALGFKKKLDWGDADTRGILLDSGDGNYMEIFAGGPDHAAAPHPVWGLNHAITHVAFRTSNVEHSTAVAKAAGATVTMEPKEILMGRPGGKQVPIYISFVQTPTGEMVEFFQNPVGEL